jgi:hypothetical protein
MTTTSQATQTTKTATVTYSLSSAGQKAILLSGGDGAATQTLTVEILRHRDGWVILS